VAGYLLLGSTWLVMKGEGPLRAAAQRSARHALVGVIVFIVVVSVWTPLADRGIAARWFAWPNLLVFSPVPVLTAWLAWLAARALRRGRDVLPFVASIGLFFLGFSGLTISLWPHVAAVGDVVVGRVGAGVAGISDDRHRVHAARAAAVRVLVVLGVSRQGARRRRL
jgi:cytochrome bd-type quinol oxidase subunit 2